MDENRFFGFWCKELNRCVGKGDMLACKCPNQKLWCDERQMCITKTECKISHKNIPNLCLNCACPGQQKWCNKRKKCTKKGNCNCKKGTKWCVVLSSCIPKENNCGTSGNNKKRNQLLAYISRIQYLQPNGGGVNAIQDLQKEVYKHYWQNCGFRYENESNIMTRQDGNTLNSNVSTNDTLQIQ